jgi:protein AATF/BFR2
LRQAKLKTVNTILKDEKYRGKTTSRRDIFEGTDAAQAEDLSEDDENEDDDADSDLSGGDDLDESASAELSDQGDNSAEETSQASGSSDSEEMVDEQEEDQTYRRDKVRQLLAEEAKCFATSKTC